MNVINMSCDITAFFSALCSVFDYLDYFLCHVTDHVICRC